MEAWEPNSASEQCRVCGVFWNIFLVWEHHCRSCGKVVCDSCSLARIPLPYYTGDVRACTVCLLSIGGHGIELVNISTHLAPRVVNPRPTETVPISLNLDVIIPPSAETVSRAFNMIPLYLQNSLLFKHYQSNNTDPNETIPIPVSHFKEDDKVSTLGDFALLLRVMDYWGLFKIPDDLLLFCYINDISDWTAVVGSVAIHSLRLDRAVLEALLNISQAPCPIIRAMETNHDRIVQYLADQNGFKRSLAVTSVAAGMGRLDYLTLLHEKGFVWDESTCYKAADKGNLDCLMYAFEHDCPCYEDSYLFAAAGGHLPCMQYLHSQGVPWHADVCKKALKNNQLECLLFAQESGCPWDDDFIFDAMREQGLECFNYVLERMERIPPEVCNHAARAGYLPVQRMLHERQAPWSEASVAAAAGSGHVNTLCYMLEQGCPIGSAAYVQAAEGGYLACIQLLRKHELLRNRTSAGTVVTVNPLSWDARTTSAALRNRYLHVLRYAVTNGCPCDADLTVQAARTGDLPCLKFAVEKGRVAEELEILATAAAAGSGDLNCVMYLHKLKYEWNESAVDSAAREGHFSVLEYITRRGCPCSADAMVLAAAAGSLPCLQLLHEKQKEKEKKEEKVSSVPTADGALFPAALLSSSPECVDYVINTMKVLLTHYVFHAPVDVPPPPQVLDDDKMLRCAVSVAEAGWRWNVAFMQFLREHKCHQSLQYLRESKRKCTCLEGAHFTHALGTHHACSAYEKDHKWAHVNFSDSSMSSIALRAMCNRAWRYAGAYGCVDCVGMLFDQRVPGELEGVLAATKAGWHQCLAFMLEHGCAADATITAAAAGAGQVMCLHELCKYGCAYDESLFNAAAREGKADTLSFAQENMAPLVTYETAKLAAAAHTGSLECLKIIIDELLFDLQEDAPHSAVFGAAFMRADAPCVQFLIDRNCPVKHFCFNAEIDLIPV